MVPIHREVYSCLCHWHLYLNSSFTIGLFFTRKFNELKCILNVILISSIQQVYCICLELFVCLCLKFFHSLVT